MVSFQWASYYLFKIFPQHNLLFFLTYHKLIFNIIITCHMTRGCCRVVAQLGTMPTPASVWVSVSDLIGDVSTPFSSICFFFFCLRSYHVGGRRKDFGSSDVSTLLDGESEDVQRDRHLLDVALHCVICDGL